MTRLTISKVITNGYPNGFMLSKYFHLAIKIIENETKSNIAVQNSSAIHDNAVFLINCAQYFHIIGYMSYSNFHLIV